MQVLIGFLFVCTVMLFVLKGQIWKIREISLLYE